MLLITSCTPSAVWAERSAHISQFKADLCWRCGKLSWLYANVSYDDVDGELRKTLTYQHVLSCSLGSLPSVKENPSSWDGLGSFA